MGQAKRGGGLGQCLLYYKYQSFQYPSCSQRVIGSKMLCWGKLLTQHHFTGQPRNLQSLQIFPCRMKKARPISQHCAECKGSKKHQRVWKVRNHHAKFIRYLKGKETMGHVNLKSGKNLKSHMCNKKPCVKFCFLLYAWQLILQCVEH